MNHHESYALQKERELDEIRNTDEFIALSFEEKNRRTMEFLEANFTIKRPTKVIQDIS